MRVTIVAVSLVFSIFAIGIWRDFRKPSKSTKKMEEKTALDKYICSTDIATAGFEATRDNVGRL